MQFKGTDMIHDIPKLRIFPIYLAELCTYYCDMYSGHGKIQGIRGARKQLQQEENTRIALDSTTTVPQS